MTNQTISGAVAAPIDEGIGSVADGSEAWASAAYLGALAQATGTAFKLGLGLENIDAGNEQVDVAAGHAYVNVSGTQAQSAVGGLAPPSYDTTLPEDVTVVLVVPSAETNLALDTDASNDVYVALATDNTVSGVSTGDVYLRFGSGVSAPSHPSLKLGTADTSGGGSVTQANEGPILTAKEVVITDTA